MHTVRPIMLDERLGAVAALFQHCRMGADIGADHGKLSAWLLQEARCQYMLVSDISASSLEKARRLIDQSGLSDRALFQTADGFDAIKEPVNCVAVCGLGSRTICSMIRRKPELPGHPALILSAHTEIPLLRKTLFISGYDIEREVLVRCNGRFYIIIKAIWGEAHITEKELFIGKNMNAQDTSLLVAYYRWLLILEEKKQKKDVLRIEWLKEELNLA